MSQRPVRHPQTSTPTDAAGRLLLPAIITLLTVALTGEGRAASTSPGLPRVVVSIMVDQLRSDCLEAFMPLYGPDGFRRIINGGRVYTNAEYPMARPDAASAAATVAAGCPPSAHGIIGRKWLDRSTLRPVFCTDDSGAAGTGGTIIKASPARLGVSTLGDELKSATDGRALVYALAPNVESALLSAGHAADGAVWIDDNTGRWCSTDYYGAMPAWATVRSEYHSIDKQLRDEEWRPVSEFVGSFSYSPAGGMKKPFAHKMKGDSRFADFKTSGPINEEVVATAQTLLSGTTIGSDDIPDHIAVTLYAGGYRHMGISQVPMEMQDTYVRLDRAIGSLIDAVERKVGTGRALFVLTSTGYIDEESGNPARYRIPTGTFDMKRASALLGMYLVAVYGQGQYIEACQGTQIYLNHKLIEEKQINVAELLERAQDFLIRLSGVKDVYTSSRLITGAWTPGISRIRAGYFPQTSGDIMIEVSPGWRYVSEDTRQEWLVRESFIPYPIIFYGFGITPDRIETPVTVDRIAPTLSKAMRIRAPNACAAAPLF